MSSDYFKENLDQMVEADIPIRVLYQFGIDGSSGDSKPAVQEIIVEGAGE
jgi:hypothetical protein